VSATSARPRRRSGEDEEHGGPVEFKDGSRVEHACLMCYRGQVVTTEEALKERES
jgi:hypothetical protein